jgi:DNA-binding LacI/PurR family transcriptional regulator
MHGTLRQITLHDQLVAALRDGIDRARWSGHLPSESVLSREFKVSRMTLRKALSQLAAEKWIALGGRGKAHGILRRPRGKKRSHPTARTIRVLTPFRFTAHNTSDFDLLEILHERASSVGYRIEIEVHRGIYQKFQASRLERLDAQPDTAGWLLYYSTASIQRWFARRARPTVVIGRVHGDLPLSCVYPDTGAAVRHAVGRLHAAGHKDMIYLIESLTSLGDRIASEVMVEEARRLGARARVVSYDGNPDAIRKTLLDLLAARPRPTAFVSGAPGIAITLLCHLLAAGVRIPTEAAVVTLWDDVNLEDTFPTIARYRTDGKLMGRKVENVLTDLLRHGTGKTRAIPVMPEFVPGGSARLGPVNGLR